MKYDIRIESINAITRRRGELLQAEGPPEMNPHTLPEHMARIKQAIKAADRHANYGYREEALKELVNCLAMGVLCLDEHLEGEAKAEIKVQDEVEGVPMEDLLLIARYEMYASLETHKLELFTDDYINTLPEDQKRVLDRYLNAKIKALAGECFNGSGPLNKNAAAASLEDYSNGI